VTTPLDPALTWALLAAVGALLALDDTSVAQTWLSQPLPAAILGGLVLGDPLAGLVPGVLAQLVVVGNMPIGAALRLDASSAALGVTAGAVLVGHTAPADDLAAAWTADGAVAAGALTVAFALLSLAGGVLVRLEYRARLGWMLDGYRSVRDGDIRRLERLQGRCLAVTAARGAVLTVLWTLLVAATWRDGPPGLPAPAAAVLGLVPWFVPALAAGSMLERFSPRRALPWVGGAAVFALALARLVS
jgi:PTS system mannose-specific IIC component